MWINKAFLKKNPMHSNSNGPWRAVREESRNSSLGELTNQHEQPRPLASLPGYSAHHRVLSACWILGGYRRKVGLCSIDINVLHYRNRQYRAVTPARTLPSSYEVCFMTTEFKFMSFRLKSNISATFIDFTYTIFSPLISDVKSQVQFHNSVI